MNSQSITQPSKIQDDASASTGSDLAADPLAHPSTCRDAAKSNPVSASSGTAPGTASTELFAAGTRAKRAKRPPARPELLSLFDASPPWARFTEKEAAEILRCSTAKLQRDRWAGTGLPFVREDGSIFYLQETIATRVKDPVLHTSTAAADVSQ